MPSRTDEKIRCSFCGKTQDQVRKLIAPATTLDRVIDTLPEVVDKVTAFWDQQQEKRREGVDPDVAE